MNETLNSILELIENHLWEHGTSLGLNGTVDVPAYLHGDPESFLINIGRLGHNNPRLLRETTVWIRTFQDKLNPYRFRRILDGYNEHIEFESIIYTLNNMMYFLEGEIEETTKEFEMIQSSLSELTDESFKYKSDRFEEFFESREVTTWDDQTINTIIQSSNRLWCRTIFNNKTNAELMSFFQSGGSGNSHSIARSLQLDQSSIHQQLKRLYQGGVIDRWEEGRSINYEWNEKIEGFPSDNEYFVNWAPIYHELLDLYQQCSNYKQTDLTDYQESVVWSDLQDREKKISRLIPSERFSGELPKLLDLIQNLTQEVSS
jgi:DNA-binding transcriptional ArsR family regulator